jgi:hypothetical protein
VPAERAVVWAGAHMLTETFVFEEPYKNGTFSLKFLPVG